MKEGLKFFYRILPGKKYLYTLIRKFWVPGKQVYKHLHFNGRFKVNLSQVNSFLLYNHHSEIENDIFWEGIDQCWEKVSLKLWMELSKDAQVIFDVGAYTGIYSLVAKCVNPSSSIYTFEPSLDNYQKLLRNNEVNKYDIICENLGVSASNVRVEIEGIYQKNKFVESVSLDSYIAKHNISRVDLIKIDV